MIASDHDIGIIYEYQGDKNSIANSTVLTDRK